LEANIFFYFEKILQPMYYNSGAVGFISEVLGLAPGLTLPTTSIM
jgi:hypothetical protein